MEREEPLLPFVPPSWLSIASVARSNTVCSVLFFSSDLQMLHVGFLSITAVKGRTVCTSAFYTLHLLFMRLSKWCEWRSSAQMNRGLKPMFVWFSIDVTSNFNIHYYQEQPRLDIKNGASVELLQVQDISTEFISSVFFFSRLMFSAPFLSALLQLYPWWWIRHWLHRYAIMMTSIARMVMVTWLFHRH